MRRTVVAQPELHAAAEAELDARLALSLRAQLLAARHAFVARSSNLCQKHGTPLLCKMAVRMLP